MYSTYDSFCLLHETVHRKPPEIEFVDMAPSYFELLQDRHPNRL